LKPTYKSLFSLLLTLLISLFYGCSGHTLQDLIDGKQTKTETQAKQEDKTATPSQNSALNAISPSTTASDKHVKYRYIQKETNIWLENEWEPLTEQNESVTKSNNTHKGSELDTQEQTIKDENNNTVFTLQHYVDKTERYFENKKKRDANKSSAPSHVEKINTLPAIGKPARRR